MQRGVIQARSDIDLVIKTAREVALMFGLRVQISEQQVGQDEQYLPNGWGVNVKVLDRQLTRESARKLGDRIVEELSDKGVLLSITDSRDHEEGELVSSDELLQLEPDDDPRSCYGVLYPEAFDSFAIGVVIYVDIWPWDGPFD